MKTYPVPANEEARIETLHSYQILDTPPDPYFNDIALIASIICKTPIALVSLVDTDRQWFKAKVGLSAEETRRDVAFCAHTIMGKEVMEVEDATLDQRFKDNPLVLQDPRIRFYAGTPLITSNQCAMGTLCVVDSQTRKLTDDQTTALTSLGRQVVALLELHRNYIDLERLSKNKDEFIRIASHDLKNPLQTILGASSIFGDTVKPGTQITEEIYNMMTRIPEKSLVMKRIIEDFLDFHAMEDGQIKVDFQTISLNEIACSVFGDHKDYAAGKGIELHLDLEENLNGLCADVERIRQVMDNLVSNAVKFSGPETDIILRTHAEEGQAVFEVRDAGPGIPLGDMDKLFTKYARLSNKPTGNEKSTGLGLSICKGLIELHKGSIGARNNPDRGATFWFKVPLT